MNQKVALVTGASKGMGLEWCAFLAKHGHETILTASSFEKANQAASELEKQGLKAIPFALDVTKASDRVKLSQFVLDSFGKLDLLVNNAGVNSRTRAKGDETILAKNLLLQQLDEQEVLAMININAISPILLARELLPALSKSNRGVVLNISSWLSSITIKNNGGNYGYAVSKSALNMMNRAFAFDVQPLGITSVVVNPGWIQTDMGGNKAPMTPSDAVHNLFKIAEKLSPQDAGKFFNYNGEEHPW